MTIAVAAREAVGAPISGAQRVRVDRLVPLVVAALVLVVAILTITPWPVGAFQDDAIYTVLAKALASGDGFRMINLPGAPHATHYPPGYPLFLAALWKLSPSFPDNIVVFKFANAVLLSLVALGTYGFARVRLAMSVGVAAACALLGTVSIVVLLITGVVLSEPLFMALLLPVLLLAERTVESGRAGDAALAGLGMGALALVRTLGAVAVPAAIVVLVARRRIRAALILGAGAALLLVPWQLWVNAYQHEVPAVVSGKYGAYGPWLTDGYRLGGMAFARAVAIANVQSLDQILNYMFMPVTAVGPRAVAFVVVALLGLGGLIVLVRHAPVTAATLAAYGTVILLWPFEPNRFVLAVWPLFMLSLALAIRVLVRWRPARPWRWVRVVGLAAALYVACGYGLYNIRGYQNQWWASVQRDAGRRAKPIAEWVARHTAPTDVLATEDDLIVYLYTGRRALPTSTFLPLERLRPLTAEEDARVVRGILASFKPRFYITVSKVGIGTAETLAAQSPPLLRRYSQTSNALIYERIEP